MRRLAAVFKRKGSQSSKSKRSWKPWVKTPDEHVEQDDDSLLNFTQHLLSCPPPSSPFSTHSSALYPRSVNPPSPRHPHDMRTRLLTANLLPHIHSPRPPIQLPTLKHAYPPPPVPPLPDFPNARYPSRAPSTSSPGLRRWTTRPCFEQRHRMYSSTCTDPLPISASFAIAALEYSEHIDLMADPDLLLHTSPPPNTLFDSAPALPSSRNSYTAVPSPLRNQHTHASTSVKRIVRFADAEVEVEDGTDDSDSRSSADDRLPLHMVRQQHKKAQKAKFLRMERLRRARQLEEERQRQDREMRDRGVDEVRERERRMREREDKEKRERERYAEEVINARMRREIHRTGGVTGVEARRGRASELLGSSASSSSLLGDARPKPLASRREVSDAMVLVPTSGTQNSASPSSSSPGSSRPPSFIVPGGVGATPTNGPGSTYSSSSEDVRAGGGSRRGSMVHPHTPNIHPQNPSMSMPMIVSAHPAWSASNPNVNAQSWGPPIPVSGPVTSPFLGAVDMEFGLGIGLQDMPLLPPAAPFMKHSGYDRKSLNSASNSRERESSKSSRRSGSSHSGSGSGRPERERGVTYPAPASRSQNASSTSLNGRRASHGRDGSGDSRHSRHSMMGGASPSSSIGASTMAATRGRPALPSSMTMPALSSRTSMGSMTMPMMPSTHSVPVLMPSSYFHANANSTLPTMNSNMNMNMMSAGPPTSSANALAVQNLNLNQMHQHQQQQIQQIQMQQAQMAQMHARMQMQQAQAQFEIARAQAEVVKMQMGMGMGQSQSQGVYGGAQQQLGSGSGWKGGQSQSQSQSRRGQGLGGGAGGGGGPDTNSNPWTALPSQDGVVPVKMPVSPYSHDLGSLRGGGGGGGNASGGSGGNGGGGSLSSRRSVGAGQMGKTQTQMQKGYSGWRASVVS